MQQSKSAKTITILIIVFLVMALATSVTYLKKGGWASDKIRVVTTILPLADFVRQVGKDMVDVTTMVAPGDSPHALQFAPSKLEMLSQADMYIKVGSNVDFELALMDEFIALNSTMHVVDCSQSIELLVADGDDHDNNDHEGADPHIWLSLTNAKQMVQSICDGLVAIDPDNADFYSQNKVDYSAQLDKLNDYIEQTMDGHANRNLLIYHSSFGYFADEHSLTQHAIEVGGSETTAKTLAGSINLARQYNLDYVFVSPESEKDKDNANIIAGQIGGRLKEIDPLPADYISNMRSVADAIAQELE